MKKYKLEKVIDVYSLDEMLADDEKKQKLLEQNQPSDVETQIFLEYEMEDIVETLGNVGFTIDTKNSNWYHYDVSGCQGSGASFIFTDVDIETLIEKYPNEELAKELDDIVNSRFESTQKYLKESNNLPRFYGKWNHLANHYTHSKTVDIYVDEIDSSDELISDIIQTRDFKEYIEEIRQVIEKIYYDAAGNMYNKLEKQYNYMYSEEGVKEYIEGSGYLGFTEDGKPFSENLYEYSTYNIIPYRIKKGGIRWKNIL